MTPIEQTFIREIRETIRTPGQFRQAVKDGLAQLMGESPAEILVMGVSEAGFRSPAQFVREVSKVFGGGASSMYSAILSTAKDPEWLFGLDGIAPYRPRTGGLDPNALGALPGDGRSFYLHDQRDPDEFSEEDPH